ncbi:flavin-containing monooxygenase [Rhodococcus artemisiae]|uniref:NAD(P)/FAD-dependent oxidoreductase n=1 Tax=Rhodococcus artemisiae TaxID=714159 RepID=A0ABU7LI97_9NOCA|nr:NAD(P)/FAD-dependent oxidoreductase [Rhodococcus artemisiae]MEE2061293.1 NAD(P)/FAD-dependent oxidoreductase [Rhodococcus artemisiae]
MRPGDAGSRESLPRHVHTLIVGAGFGGIGMAATLLRDDPGADVLVVERGDDVGGTWRENTYPGAACDVPSALYSFSFAPESEWTRAHGTRAEIYAYLQRVAREQRVTERTMFGCQLRDAQWDGERARWVVSTSRGDLTADVLVAATGALSTPALPKVAGLEVFSGTMFHSAEWDHNHNLTGARVAVIGTGASAIQFVPEIVGKVDHLTLFQRTASWVMPKRDHGIASPVRSLYRRFPFVQKAVRGAVYGQKEMYVVGMTKPLARKYALPLFEKRARSFLRKQVPDPELRNRLTPDFAITCKRILLSNEWFPAITRSNVEVVSSALTSVTENGVVDADGNEYPVDTIIFGTGFTPSEPPVAQHVRGEHGRTLAEVWNGSPSAHLGISVNGFPNLFLMYGPNTNLGHSSIVYMLESQAAYIAAALRVMRTRRLDAVEVRADAQRRFAEELDPMLAGTVWNTGGCSSWYLDRTGRNSVMWPTFTWHYRTRTKEFDAENYDLRAANTGARG